MTDSNRHADPDSDHFAFGQNWLDYSEKITEKRIEQAVANLRRLADGDLSGRSFLDIGCGSGLSSVAALRLGASRVVGFDLDPDSITASRNTVARFAAGADAIFEVMSVFDARPKNLGQFDIVYSWGVLHHTGDLHRAFRATAALASPGGELQVALYKKTPFCGIWRQLKRLYSRAEPASQRRARETYKALVRAGKWLTGKSFRKFVADYAANRGMEFDNDIHDWLGGFPYESISPEACRELGDRNGLRLVREFIRPPSRFAPGLLGSGCDEYVFAKPQVAAEKDA